MPYKQQYTFTNETGDADITVYHVLPGVEAAFVSVHMDQFDFQETEKSFRDRYVGFHYCREGRIEQEADGEFFYLMPGDCSVVIRDRPVKKFSFPMKHYHGISIGIDTEAASGWFADFFGNNTLTPLEVAAHVCGGNHSAILRSAGSLKRIITDCYSVAEENRIVYLRIKIPELLFVLNSTDASHLSENTVPRSQVDLVRRVREYITENINEKITVGDLTVKFGVSDTYLQNAFRLVYGMPVISFMRAQKMQCAAQVLIHTSRSVDDIAEEFGYINESKFSAVFKKIMGDSPSIYRKEHSKIRIL
ncbi:MAG: helix-turn-helix transcriptional regulator [Clostridia bacterium]|nr:helix-turn-helix transcriptional regulator [Clostridia bacterium]